MESQNRIAPKETIHVFQLPRNPGSYCFIAVIILVGCSRGPDSTQTSAIRTASPPVATPAERTPPGGAPKLVAAAIAMQPATPAITSSQDAIARGLARPATAGTPQLPRTTSGRTSAGESNPEGENGVPLLKVGVTAPDFASVNLAGEEIHLSKWRDKIVVLDFWATWCGPCRAAFPHLQDVAARLKDRDVIVLAVCTSDTRDHFEEFVKANQDKYSNIVFACDPNEKGASSFDERASKAVFGVTGLPTQFVIDRRGQIAAVLEGYDEDRHLLEDTLVDLGIEIEPTK